MSSALPSTVQLDFFPLGADKRQMRETELDSPKVGLRAEINDPSRTVPENIRCLQKPFSNEDLLTSLREVLDADPKG